MPDGQIDISAGLVPKQQTAQAPAQDSGAIDISAGLVPKPPAQRNPIVSGAIGAGKGILNTIGEYGAAAGGPQYLQGGGINQPSKFEAPESLKPQGTAENVGYYGEKAAELATPFVATKMTGVLPSAARAGKALGEVEGVAGELSVDTSGAMRVARRAKELATRGNKPSQVISDFMKRMGLETEGETVTKAPAQLTFKEGRDFYSAAREMTMEEVNSLKPKMKRQLIEFANELGDSLMRTATGAGQDAKYAEALKEYRQAKNLGEALDVLKKYGIRGALGTAGAGAAYQLGKELGFYH